jgi:hypothetical protein
MTALGIAGASVACSSTPSETLAQLHLTIDGEGFGMANVDRSVYGGRLTSGTAGHGTAGMGYDPNAGVTLTETPSAGSRFVSWNVSTAEAGGAWFDHQSTDST